MEKTITTKPNYRSYETLAAQLRIGRLDNLVCMDCGVLVVSKPDHDRLHSIMSSWAWALAILKTNHISAQVHDLYAIVERIDSRQFDPVMPVFLVRSDNSDVTEKNKVDRYEIAWRIWRWRERYNNSEALDGFENWMHDSNGMLTINEIKQLDACLAIADEVISMVRNEKENSGG